METRLALGIGDDLADAFFGAEANDALSHGDAEVEEFFSAFANADFKPKLLVGAIDIGEQDRAAAGVDVGHGEVEDELHGGVSIFAVVVDLHRTHEGIGEDLGGHAGLVLAFGDRERG